MKGLINFYRILSFILLPVAALIGLFALIGLLAAIAAPAYLLGVFMLACIVIYTFTSFSFLNKGILKNTKCKPSLKDWIKVNAYVSILFGMLSISQAFVFFSKPEMKKDIIDQTMQMASQNSMPAAFSKEQLAQVMNGTVAVMLIVAIILIIHIFITFRLLAAYKNVFQQSE